MKKQLFATATVCALATSVVGCGAGVENTSSSEAGKTVSKEEKAAENSADPAKLKTTNETEQKEESVVKQSDQESLVHGSSPVTATKETPNVVYIVIDDMGFSDLGCYGSEINTPNIDRLAENGLRYNNYYTCPISSPSRASLLTGRNAHSVGVSTLTNYDLGVSHSTGRLSENAATIAETLQLAGYGTMATGKWHLSPGWEMNDSNDKGQWPLSRGFDHFYGFMDAMTDLYKPDLVIDNVRVDAPEFDDFHLSEGMTDEAIKYIKSTKSHNPDKPFFLYHAFGALHFPIQVDESYIEKYEEMYQVGWDVIREQRFEKQKELGIIPKDAELAPLNDQVVPWDTLTEKEQAVYARMMASYAGLLEHTDEQIGRLLDELETMGELDNTLIFLVSDNGANPEGAATGYVYESPLQNAEKVEVEDMYEDIDIIGTKDTTLAMPLGWSQVSNTPFAYYKFNPNFLGGIRVPMIVSYPALIKDSGAIREQTVAVTDISATVMDIIGAEFPKTYKGIEQMPVHGISILPTLLDGTAESQRTTQYFEAFGVRGLYHDGWFLSTIHKSGEPYENDQFRLYNLSEDYSQIHDIAEENSEKLEEMKQVWQEEAEKYGVLPMVDTPNGTNVFNEILKNVKKTDKLTYYRETPHSSTTEAVKIGLNRSNRVRADIVRNTKEDEGVIFAVGGDSAGGGYSLYIMDNRLYYTYNYEPDLIEAVSEIEVPVGASTVGYNYENIDYLKARVTLVIDEQEVGSCIVERAFPILPSSTDTMDVGIDRQHNVSERYEDKGYFRFSGELKELRIDLDDDWDMPGAVRE